MLTNSLSQKFAYSALVQRPVKLDLNILTFGAFRYQQRHGHTATQRESTAVPLHYLFCLECPPQPPSSSGTSAVVVLCLCCYGVGGPPAAAAQDWTGAGERISRIV